MEKNIKVSSSEYLQIYFDKATGNVSGGGLSPQSAALWDVLLQHQFNIGVSGNLGEIGIWYGFASAMMALHKKSGENMILIDNYLQKENVLSTINKVVEVNLDEINLINIDSISARKRMILKDNFDTFRWFHIDGEHSYNAVMSDLDMVAQCMKEGGIIVVDDFFNWGSAGITQAVFNWLNSNDHIARMFCCAFNKAYLCSPKFLVTYRDLIYYNINDILEKIGIKTMVIQNGWGTEIDYIGVVNRIQDYQLQKIGKYCAEIEPFG